MKAFHNNLDIKHKYLERVRAHRKADNLIQGTGWRYGKGCAVGCTLEVYDHSLYPIELGIPEWLAKLEDAIFENLPNDKAMMWPERFLAAINAGSDLRKIDTHFIIYVLGQTIVSMDACVFDRDSNPEVVKAIEGSRVAALEMIRCHRNGSDYGAARDANLYARYAADSAARYATLYARYAAWSAESVALSASTWTPWCAMLSAASCAQRRALSADEHDIQDAASVEYENLANKLIELLEECR